MLIHTCSGWLINSKAVERGMSDVCCGSSDAVRSPNSLPLPHSGDRHGFIVGTDMDSVHSAFSSVVGKDTMHSVLLAAQTKLLEPRARSWVTNACSPSCSPTWRTISPRDRSHNSNLPWKHIFLGIKPNINYRAKSAVKMTTRGMLKAHQNEGNLYRIFPTMGRKHAKITDIWFLNTEHVKVLFNNLPFFRNCVES